MLSDPDAPRAASASAHNNSSPIGWETLKKRSDFVAIGKNGKRFSCHYFALYCLKQPEDAKVAPIRIGYTVSKRVSKKAVIRNRIKRRLRAAVSEVMPTEGRGGYDYVIIARADAATAPFTDVIQRLRFALNWLHNERRKS